jgi:hypothetical protein
MSVRIPGEGEKDSGERENDSGLKVNSDSDGKAKPVFARARNGFHDARNGFHKHSGAGHHSGTMNPPREDQSAGQETVHAETTGGSTPPIRTQTGPPADRAKLRDRGRHGSQVPETRRSGGRHVKSTCGRLPIQRAAA